MVDKFGGYFPPPFKGYRCVNPGRSPIPCDIQYGSVLCHLPLDDGGSGDRCGSGGTWYVGRVPGGIFLRLQWTCHVDPNREAK